ncbi:MAG: PDZ domain-containing protein [Anaerolineaceae bacterium]|nr:PDZ domain-containing protein [Anaerolineaceae bacterium]
MKKRTLTLLVITIITGLIFSACVVADLFSGNKNEIPVGEAIPSGPVLITGSFEYTNDFVVETYYVEHAVALLDMTGFVMRDKEWELPVESQVLGFMDLDEDNNSATYRLSLPAVPAGEFNDVDNDNIKEKGLQIFTVGYNPNLTDGVFSEGDDRSLGWPGYLASVKTDSENQDEVKGGKLVVWAADSDQEFPSDFGADGLLFTEDDPVVPISAGYSVVDLDQSPFIFDTDTVVDITLYEPDDIAVKDFSDLSYTEAFDAFFDVVRKEYAFNGFKGKQPDWDAVYADLKPKIARAEEERDAYGYYLALREFSLIFKDGHVDVSGGDFDYRYNEDNILGGFGFAVRELDDGRVIVVYILQDGPADQAGMQVGAEIVKFNGDPVQDALEKVQPFQPQSTDYGKRYEQTVFLTRSGIGQPAEVTYRNPDGQDITVQMVSVYEMDSLLAVYLGGPYDEFVLPVEYKLLPSRVGYIKINSNYDDLGLLIRVFERALATFEEVGVPGIIIDMRLNFGGAPLGLAGFLYDKNILLGQLEYFSDKTGQFEPEGPRDKVFPNENIYSFDKMILLVDQFCFSACEIESYGFSQVPGMVVMGQFPTAGVEAETARGEFQLPEGIKFGVPTGRFMLPDGSIFLEGKGVQPTVRIPVDEHSVLSGEDVVLRDAINYILLPNN